MTNGPLAGAHRLAGLVDVKLHPVEVLEKVVRKLDIRLVDLVDQKDHATLRLERLPELALADIGRDIVHAGGATD